MNEVFSKILLLIFLIFVHQYSLYAGGFGFNNSVLKDSTFHVTLSGKYYFSNKQEYNFTPIDIATSSPMIKITSSDVYMDFGNIGITNQDDTHVGWIGIEIGWTPQELIDDPARVQPKNVVIENVSLYNFDCAIFVHAGVEGVSLRNCKIYKTLAGIISLGLANSYCSDFYFENVTIFGISGDYHSALQTFKTRIETDYAYGLNHFMKLQADTLNSNTVDAHTYYGIFMKHVNNGTFKAVTVKNIGYEMYATTSEGNGGRTEAIGICIKDSQRIKLYSAFVSDTASELKAVGLQVDNIKELSVDKSDFSYSNSAVKAVGIEVTNDSALPYSVASMYLKGVETKSNIADQIAIGMDLSAVQGLAACELISKFNKGDTQTYGVYTTKLYTVHITDAKFSENTSTRQTNDVATTMGIVAVGFYGENVNSMRIEQVDFTSMQAMNSSYGLYLKDSTSILFNNSNFTANIATTLRSGEAADIRIQQDAQEISMFAPVVDATGTGAYGVFLTNCQFIKFENCIANSNAGHRAVGISARNCRAIALWDTFASTQSATGGIFDTTLLTENTDPTNIVTQLIHRPLLFGDLTKTSVDVVKATDLFLEKLTAIRAAQLAGTEPVYADVITMIATQSLLQATIARYRTWGTAMGVHVHNVSGFILKNCNCVGQVSLFDNAVGICFSGRNVGHTIENCNLSFNVGNYYSIQTMAVPGSSYTYSYNMLGMQLFWKMILEQREPWTVLQDDTLSVSVNVVAFSPDATKLAVGTSNNEIKVYDVSDWSLLQTLTGHTAPITSLSWKADGTQLASAASSSSNNIKIWNTSTWVADQTLTHGSAGVNALAYSPDESKLVSGSSDVTNNIAVWNTSSWTSNLETHGAGVTAVAWKHNSTRFATGSVDSSNNIKIWYYSISDWHVDETLNSHTAGVNSLDWNSDGTQLVSGSADGTVKIWETTGWTVSQTISPSAGDVHTVKFKPDDSLLAVGCETNVVNVYKTSDWNSEISLIDFTNAALSVDWIANGRLLATASSDTNYRVYNSNIWKKAAAATDVGLYIGSGNYKFQDSLNFSSTIDNEALFIDLMGTKYPFVSPVGPIGAGLIMGDLMFEGRVKNSTMYTNTGHAGQAYGVLFNKAFSVTLENNIISGSNSNIHGCAVGVFDVTAHSPNLYIKNCFEGNKCSTYNNANYLIPFNPSDSNTLALPVKKILNGKFSGVNEDGYENLVIEYSQEPEFYSYESLLSIPFHPDLSAQLTSNDCWS